MTDEERGALAPQAPAPAQQQGAPATKKPGADKPQTGQFEHPENIQCGHGRVMFSVRDVAWVLPGGELTRERSRAVAVAVAIDRITTESKRARHPPAQTATWPRFNF